MPRSPLPSPFEPEMNYTIVPSGTSVNVDGYKLGEPMYLKCDEYGARELLTQEPTPGADEFNYRLLDGE